MNVKTIEKAMKLSKEISKLWHKKRRERHLLLLASSGASQKEGSGWGWRASEPAEKARARGKKEEVDHVLFLWELKTLVVAGAGAFLWGGGTPWKVRCNQYSQEERKRENHNFDMLMMIICSPVSSTNPTRRRRGQANCMFFFFCNFHGPVIKTTILIPLVKIFCNSLLKF